MTTATATSPGNITLFDLCYFAIILTRSTFTKMTNYPGTKLVGVGCKLRNKMKNSHLCVHAVHKTLDVVISRCRFAEDDKEMYQNVTRTCRAKLPNYGFKTLVDACVINNFFFRRSTGHLYKLLKM